MSGRPSAATERALERVRAGETGYSAAKGEGLAISTVYRAMRNLPGWQPRSISAPTERSALPAPAPADECTPLPEPAPSEPLA